ncbi:hypothetical protein L873DRAFT_1792435 [Choiromyces venosus 120613-1]|uniref:Uncharacterized protein n=1 Tax=Choiromyces venosus 120613-1 TaxID=1336337 RepID=A0A3N4JDA5_9PEZI|nr:hypothetical protein L873DRAFT_1792435 [Choiromyces venosus 120613-1]
MALFSLWGLFQPTLLSLLMIQGQTTCQETPLTTIACLVGVLLMFKEYSSDPLDLLVYCYRNEDNKALATPLLRWHSYFTEDMASDWGIGLATHIGQMHFRLLAPDAQADHKPIDQHSELQERDDPTGLPYLSFGSASDVLMAIDSGMDPGRILPSPVSNHAQSPPNCVLWLLKPGAG